MLRIVTDSAADVPAEWRKEFDILVMPANIQFAERTYQPGVDLDVETFYQIVDQTRQIPKTYPPSVEQFIEFYRNNASQGDTILSIHITSKLSETLVSAKSAAGELKGEFTVIPIDSLNGTAGIGMLCREARIQERAGKSVEEIIYHIEQLRSKIGIVLTLDTLEYARMSGRVGLLRAMLASMLNVKPIVVLTDGILEMAERVRSRDDSLERVVAIVKEEVGDRPVNIAIVHARDPQAGNALMEKTRKTFNIKELILTDLSLSVAANLGPGTVGIVYCPLE
jgi:DegV family protein with EDD domain